jgi:hypothetical protein
MSSPDGGKQGLLGDGGGHLVVAAFDAEFPATPQQPPTVDTSAPRR